MTTKVLSGTYASGYTLSAAFTGVNVTSTGSLSGAAGTPVSPVYPPFTPATAGGAALTLPNGGALANHGLIQGGVGGGGGYAYYDYATGATYGVASNGAAGGAGVVAAAKAQITNFNTIRGGAGGYGGYFNAGFGGGLSHLYAAGPSGAGIILEAGGAITNLGVIAGGGPTPFVFPNYESYAGVGVDLTAGGSVVNGSASNRAAVISGGIGVSLAGAGTVANFATIAGSAVNYGPDLAVKFGSASDVLIAEGGSTFIGAVEGGGGTLMLRGGGAGTIDGISGFGRVSFFTGASWVFQGDNEIPTGLTVRAGSTIAVDGTLATHGAIAADMTVAGELAIAGGGVLSLVGGTLTNLASGTLTGGTFAVGAGERLMLPNDAAITTLDASIEFLGGKAAVVWLDTTTGKQVGLQSSLTAIGATGALEIAGGASFSSFNAIANAGTIEALGGTVVIAGAVSGSGSVEIGGGGMATFAGAFAENVSFAAGAGELALGKSQGYTGTISGFSTSGADSLDLRDIGFKSGTTKASYSGAAAGGVLTVTDGMHTSHIHLAGNFLSSTWTLSSDGHGGTTVVDPTAPSVNVAPLATAMAGFGGSGGGGASLATPQAWTVHPPSLAAPLHLS